MKERWEFAELGERELCLVDRPVSRTIGRRNIWFDGPCGLAVCTPHGVIEIPCPDTECFDLGYDMVLLAVPEHSCLAVADVHTGEMLGRIPDQESMVVDSSCFLARDKCAVFGLVPGIQGYCCSIRSVPELQLDSAVISFPEIDCLTMYPSWWTETIALTETSCELWLVDFERRQPQRLFYREEELPFDHDDTGYIQSTHVLPRLQSANECVVEYMAVHMAQPGGDRRVGVFRGGFRWIRGTGWETFVNTYSPVASSVWDSISIAIDGTVLFVEVRAGELRLYDELGETVSHAVLPSFVADEGRDSLLGVAGRRVFLLARDGHRMAEYEVRCKV